MGGRHLDQLLDPSQGRRLHLMRHSPSTGFTIIELVMTLAVLGILAMLAVPAMQTWIANSKVRTVADSLQNDLRLAQNEAVKRSRQVAFVLTANTPATTATPSSGGNNWYTDVLPITSGTETITNVRTSTIGSQYNATVSAKNTGTAISMLCFNSEGRLTANTSTGLGANCTVPNGTALITFDISLPAADRPLRVEVQQGGRVRLCDPAKTLSSTAPDGCT